MRLYLNIILFSIASCIYAQDAKTVSLLFVGDVMGHGTQINSAYNEDTKKYEYDGCFKYVSNIFNDADFCVANLEVTLAGPPYKGYPQFSSPDALAIAMKDAGVNAVVNANNHCVDRRKQGLERTNEVLDSLNLPRTGTFKDDEDRKKHNPMWLEKDGVTIAILNYTYGTNGIPVTKPNKVNFLDKELIKSDIKTTKAMKPDFIIAFVHWGLEYQTVENKTQRDFNKFFNDNGVNIVIGSHPHVLQPIHKTDTNFVVYSLGNFVSNQRTHPRDGGAMVRIELTKDKDIKKLSDASYYLTWVHTPTINGKKEFRVLPVNPFEDEAYFLDTKSHNRLKDYKKEAAAIYKNNTDIQEMIFNADLPGWEKK